MLFSGYRLNYGALNIYSGTFNTLSIIMSQLGDGMKDSIRPTSFRPVRSNDKVVHCYFGVRVTPDVRERLVKIARARNISVSAIIREMIAAQLVEYEEKKILTDLEPN